MKPNTTPTNGHRRKNGIVHLVGAGPGDTGLLTLKAVSALSQADAVVYDRLVNPEILHFAPQAEKIYAGKQSRNDKGHDSAARQQDINRLLVRLARSGKKVVRLKGGDPLVFGRGGEEASYLKKSGIAFELVPGVTAGTGVPAYAGIPVTDRRLASAVVFVTGHEDPSKKESSVDWKKLAALDVTLISYMSIQKLPLLIQALIEGGKSAGTLVSVIEHGTYANQRVVEGTLEDIVRKVRSADIKAPALTVIGPVNRLRKQLNWFDRKPLSGKTVMITRPKAQASALRTLLTENGAEVLDCPAIRILPPASYAGLDRALKDLNRFDWILFTSTNGVESFFKRLRELGKDARALAAVRIGVIGQATADALSQKGLVADLLPGTYTAKGLVRELRRTGNIRGRHFLLPRTDIAPEFLKKELERRGARVTEAVAYRTMPSESGRKELRSLLTAKKIDYITFTSSSTVKNFFDAIPSRNRRRIRSRLISIGPVTTQTLGEYGFKPFREAKEHTVRGLMRTLTQNRS